MLQRAECTPMYIRLRSGELQNRAHSLPISSKETQLRIMEGKTEGMGDNERKGYKSTYDRIHWDPMLCPVHVVLLLSSLHATEERYLTKYG